MNRLQTTVRLSAAMGLVTAAMVAQGQESEPKGGHNLELTVYKADFAMISENRPISIEKGRSHIVIDQMSKLLDPNSILFDWPSGKSHPSVISSTYDLGMGNVSSVYRRLNGQNVEFMWKSTDGKPGQTIEGRLEVPEQGGNYSIRTSDKLYIEPQGTVIASAKTASTLPQLSVDLDSNSSGTTDMGVSYLTRGMSWSADYIAKLNPNQKTVELECWATVVNNTGIPFPDASLILMAGSPNRDAASYGLSSSAHSSMQGLASNGVTRTLGASFGSQSGRDEPMNLASNAARVSVGDLYAYKIPSHATIGIDQMNRVSVLGTRTVPVKRTYSIQFPTLTSDGYLENDNSAGHSHVNASVALTFVNTGASNLGIPLPSGSVRVYERDEAGHERYTGADTIRDTAKQEHVELNLSDAFDVFGSYKVLKSDRIAKHKVRKTVETTLHNEKKTPVEVRVTQNFGERWWFLAESAQGQKLDASTIQWKMTVKPGEAKKLTFTVDMKD